MVALAIPLVEGVAVRVLAALGVGVVAGAAGDAARDAARKRQEAADKAKSTPIARVDAQTKTKTKKCDKCPPDCGELVPVKHRMSANSSEYQAKITGFPIGTEWRFAGRDFDGFKSDLCLLQEAKANYDQFFNKNGGFQYMFQSGIFDEMEEQAAAQAMIVGANRPASLSYYFQTPLAYNHMRPRLLPFGITVLYVP